MRVFLGDPNPAQWVYMIHSDTPMHVYVFMCFHPCTQTRIHTCTPTRSHTYTRTHIHTRIHTHIHTQHMKTNEQQAHKQGKVHTDTLKEHSHRTHPQTHQGSGGKGKNTKSSKTPVSEGVVFPLRHPPQTHCHPPPMHRQHFMFVYFQVRTCIYMCVCKSI